MKDPYTSVRIPNTNLPPHNNIGCLGEKSPARYRCLFYLYGATPQLSILDYRSSSQSSNLITLVKKLS